MSQEKFHYKDGVWILNYSHLNSNELQVAVYKDGEIRNSRKYTSKEKALQAAHEFADAWDLPIFNGTKAGWNTFNGEYQRSAGYDFDDPEIETYEYADEEIDAMDSRPKVTTKWAICQEPNLFKIYDNVQKNPERFWDTDPHRRLFSYSMTERVEDFEAFFEKNSDKVYEGTWEDVKGTNYAVLVNGRVYESRKIDKLFNNIIDAGFEVNGNEILGQLDIIGDSEDGEVLSFNFSKNEINYFLNEDKFNLKKIITIIYDCLTCVGLFFPEELTVEFKDGQYTVAVIDGQVSIGKTEGYESLKNAKIGDILMQSSPADIDDYQDKWVVVEISGKKVKMYKCSEYEKNYHWRARQYVTASWYQAAMEGNHKGQPKEINLVEAGMNHWKLYMTKEEVEQKMKNGKIHR